MRGFTKLSCAVLACVLFILARPVVVSAIVGDTNVLKEPPVFASEQGVLDLLVVARANTDPILQLTKPVGWVYEICRNPGATANACPAGNGTSTAYGGSRLSLKAGDKLRMRLVNQLPPIPEAKHALDVSPDLAFNPTNLHTHGLIVEPRYPTVARPTWGDNVFVLGFNPKNGVPQPYLRGTHSHGSMTSQPIEYEIDIPINHPSGLFWFHPHVHGIALNQVSAGLAGIITIGNVGDYACEDSTCAKPWAESNVRHLVLKDTQIEANGTLSTQQDPQFCPEFAASGEASRQGKCAGQIVPDGGANHFGGRWIFSINGQVYPTIPVASPQGEIWRITNASGSASYDLHLWDPASQRDVVFQVVSVDGVSVTTPVGATTDQTGIASASKIRSVVCPGATGAVTSTAPSLCATSVRMMPSSRVEIRVVYRNANGRATIAPPNTKFVLLTVGYETGGDNWPAIDLAEVTFKPASVPGLVGEVAGLRGQAATVHSAGIATNSSSPAATPPQNCKSPLAPGHRRRIYYGVPAGTADGFGLGYEEVDQYGTAVPGTFVDITSFVPDNTIVCLPLALGNKAVKEVWELVNVSSEDHNFHIHQTKFRVLEGQSAQQARRTVNIRTKTAGALLPFPSAAVLHDNIPLPADPTCDGSVAAWRGPNPTCLARPVVVEIAFSQIGDFVYHCHILEHEDGGMMAKISVIGRP